MKQFNSSDVPWCVNAGGRNQHSGGLHHVGSQREGGRTEACGGRGAWMKLGGVGG